MTEDTSAPAEEPATTATGDERVDAAVARLDQLDETPTEAHPQVFEEVHRDLSAALGDVDGG